MTSSFADRLRVLGERLKDDAPPPSGRRRIVPPAPLDELPPSPPEPPPSRARAIAESAFGVAGTLSARERLANLAALLRGGGAAVKPANEASPPTLRAPVSTAPRAPAKGPASSAAPTAHPDPAAPSQRPRSVRSAPTSTTRAVPIAVEVSIEVDDALPVLSRVEPETPAARQKANLAAMQLAAELARAPRELTDDDRRTLGAYTGWGGLSIKAAADKFPPGFPVPEERGLIHEYYTPSRVCMEVARVVRPLLPALAGADGRVLALEPAAGIGRFVRAFEGKGFEDLDWRVVEYSELSAAMLRALRPKLALYQGPFERWVAENEEQLAGKINLFVSNPPYGKRGASVADDPAREYRLKDAYAYFLRRGLDLLAPGGLGVFLIPSGFLTGTSKKHVALRSEVLRRHHLSAAYRLPSGLFPGTNLVTDLLFFRARGGELPEVDEADKFILEGHYFQEFPSHILGKEVGRPGDDDDQTAKPRWGYEVVGEFSSLPDLVERPMCAACQVTRQPARPARPHQGAQRAAIDTTEMAPRLASASSLGLRVDAFLAAVAAQESEEPSLAWPELHRGLVEWAAANGAPAADVELVKLAKAGDVGAQRFLAAFEPRSTKPIPALSTSPTWTPRYQGRAGDVVALAEFIYRQRRALARTDLGHLDLDPLFRAGWCEDQPGELVPGDVYYTGHLWPKYDRARARADLGLQQSAVQARRLLERIAPAMFDEIQGVSPRQGWVPRDLVEGWIGMALNANRPIQVVHEHGLLQAKGVAYETLDDEGGAAGLTQETIWCLGWINHDKTLFRPPKPRNKDVDLDEVRLAKAREWEQSFRAWCGADEARRVQVEHAYQRSFQGYRAPDYSAEPLPLARWTKDGPKLHPHQAAGTRRVLTHRGGLVAYDVGVGKTYTGLAILAAARQEGWCKRPVILVPNSIVWKWANDIRRVLPDYRVGVVGSKRKIIKSGARKGHVTSETDSPADRAATWTRFQGGEYDVVLLTYSALARTRMNEASVRAYAEHTSAIEREVKLRQRNAQNRGKRALSEREEAILKEGTAAWVAEQMELPNGWAYDPGVSWEDVGVDLLIVDEAQNFKNLYLPEAREGGVPRFMGNAGEGSKRAWQLDFRCAAVRRKTGGAGVVLLSATPAKNSPLEFYNLLQYVDHDAFARLGIRDPEQFIDRYCRIEMREVVDSKLDVVTRGAVTGFQNLHELRDVIFKYGEFKTAEQAGLKLPEPEVRRVEVDLDPQQDAKYARYVAEIERILANPGQNKGSMLGFLARMALVAIHAELDEGYDWKSAKNVPSPHSPKFDALAREVLKTPTCGHIVFCDNVAAHQWIRMVLEEAGIAPDRIAIFNAEVAEAAADRQRIAQDFNGSPDEGIRPKYDVVIANAIAYEGVDLQTRTCAIHHLDLPWEPATLQQRNGRGVRQGNRLATIAIIYYFARRSQDGMRFNLIQGKRGWMVELLESQARDTNNPGAQMDLGPEEVLLLISRDPEKTAARLAEVKAKREAEAKKKIAEEASSTLRNAVARFTRARTMRDPVEAARLRSEAEQRLEDLARVNHDAWPWASWAYAARDRAMLVPPEGHSPVYDGLRVAMPNVFDPSVTEYAEFGTVFEGKTIGVRRVGSPVWKLATIEEVVALNLRPEHVATTWPADDDEQCAIAMRERILPKFRLAPEKTWRGLGWARATEAFVERAWQQFGAEIVREMRYAGHGGGPVVASGKLRIGFGGGFDAVIAPTKAGWAEFLARAPESGLKFDAIDTAAQFWWGRSIPRNLLSAARDSAAPLSHAKPQPTLVSSRPAAAAAVGSTG